MYDLSLHLLLYNIARIIIIVL